MQVFVNFLLFVFICWLNMPKEINPVGSSFIFTLNNPVKTLVFNKDTVKYAIWQKEKGEKGTEHYQGAIIMFKGIRRSKLNDIFFDGKAHLEIARSEKAIVNYCSKDDTRIEGPWEFGTKPKGSGYRSDIEGLKDDIDKGLPMLELWNNHPSYCFKHGDKYINQYIGMKTQRRNWKTEVIFVYGKSGYGKDHWISRNISEDLYVLPCGDWFDGYRGQKDVWIQDFHGTMPFTVFNQIGDKYPMQVKVKGSFVEWVPKRIFISSHNLPRDWYDMKYDLESITRRIDKVVYINVKHGEPTIYEGYEDFFLHATY